jgi:hypothetical protein
MSGIVPPGQVKAGTSGIVPPDGGHAMAFGGDYEQLMVIAGDKTLNKFHRQAAALARKAIELDPARPKAYAMLGFALRSEGAARAARSESFADEYRGAARALVQYMQVATQRGERESFGFAPCASMAFELLVRPECADEPRPSWWDEASLRELSERAAAERYTQVHPFTMRGAVLANAPCIAGVQWSPRPRAQAAEELREAAGCFRQASKLSVEQFERRAEFDAAAAHCDRVAQQLEAPQEAAEPAPAAE